jgi:ribonuclease Y
MNLLTLLAVFIAGASLGVGAALMRARRQVREKLQAARAEAKLAISGARLKARATIKHAETEARERALVLRERADKEASRREETCLTRDEEILQREGRERVRRDRLERMSVELDMRYQTMRERKAEAQLQNQAALDAQADVVRALERRGGETSAEVMARLRRGWLLQAEGEAKGAVRAAIQSAADPEWVRRAERVMEIAVSRYRNHFLTERGVSTIALSEEAAVLLAKDGGEFLNSLAAVANVQMSLLEEGKQIRLEGLDGVGREIARRALSRLNKKPESHDIARRDPAAWGKRIRTQLDQEILGLGKKAFAVLKLPRAHPDIVMLVGRLNYRTSFTQNQWLHAVEAAFLAGMIAEELGLDVSMTRRATLLHDIGKALTHEMDGSHAVIGADIARRLGEPEIVANAIGAHHADEPPNSPYAYIVAGADAMSGARPGARREQTDGFSTRLEDLERIGHSYEGVERCYAVHGGRELRVYVSEARLSDQAAIELTSEIAARISSELTFPGQIKVTIIRATEAVAVAS